MIAHTGTTWLMGIDEAGRGPLAGPVAVGVVSVVPDFSWDELPGVDDSKKLSHQKREELFSQAEMLRSVKRLSFAVGLVSAHEIDRIGIAPSVRKAMQEALTELSSQILFQPHECVVKLDGSLTAPSEYVHQETIIGGDGKEKVIGLASIVAKVTRDRHMIRLSSRKKYAPYAFQTHKGYATKDHRAAILRLGLCDIHRRYFCQKLIDDHRSGIV